MTGADSVVWELEGCGRPIEQFWEVLLLRNHTISGPEFGVLGLKRLDGNETSVVVDGVYVIVVLGAANRQQIEMLT